MTEIAAEVVTYDRSIKSATRLEHFECSRFGAFHYWGYMYNYEREPKSGAQSLGIELHKYAEEYLKDGKTPDTLTLAGELFQQALPYLPPPKTGGIEGRRTLTVGGHEYELIIDLFAMLDRAVRPPPRPDKMYIADHKTSSNMEAYGMWQKYTTGEGFKERKGFLDDFQAVIDAAWYMARTGEREANLMWLYYGFKQVKRKDPLTNQITISRGPPFKAKPSYITLERGEVEDAFGNFVHPRAELIERIETSRPHPLTLDPNPACCHRFGKDCHYKSVCNLDPRKHAFAANEKKPRRSLPVVTQEETKTMSNAPAYDIKAALEARKKAAAAAASTPSAAQVSLTSVIAATKADQINPPEAKAVSAPAPAPAETVATVVAKAAPSAAPPGQEPGPEPKTIATPAKKIAKVVEVTEEDLEAEAVAADGARALLAVFEAFGRSEVAVNVLRRALKDLL